MSNSCGDNRGIDGANDDAVFSGRVEWGGSDGIVRGHGDRGAGVKNSAIGNGTEGNVLEGDRRDWAEKNFFIYDRHRVGVWLVTLAILAVWLTLGRVVEWMALPLCLSYACDRRNLQEHPLEWGRFDSC